MKNKFFAMIITSTMLSMAVVGCGSSDEVVTNDMAIDSTEESSTDEVTIEGGVDESTEESTEEVEVIEDSTEEVTEEVVEETIEDVVVGDDWFSQNGYKVNGVGDFSYIGDVCANHNMGDGNWGLSDTAEEVTGTFNVSETINGDTKTVTAIITQHGFAPFDDGYYTIGGEYFIADRYTGQLPITNYEDIAEFGKITIVTKEDREITIQIANTSEYAYQEGGDRIDTIEVTVPADYDGLVFGITPAYVQSNFTTISEVIEAHKNYQYPEGTTMLFFAE